MNTLLITLVALAGAGLLLALALMATRANTTPDLVVERFYTNWLDAVRGAPPSSIERGLHTKSTYVTERFGRYVAQEAAQGHDGVLCSTTTPAQVTVGPAVIEADGTRASVDVTRGSSVSRVYLVHDARGWWRIDEVDCAALAANTAS